MQEVGRSESIPAALSLVGLTRLMEERSGDPSFLVGIIDGPLDLDHTAFAGSTLRTVRPDQRVACRDARSTICSHGTGIAGILCANRGSPAPAICPSCTFLLYPIFPEASHPNDSSAAVTPAELARAIIETVDAGARIINLSLGVIPADTSTERELDEACDYAARRGAVLVVAAGNQGRIGFLPMLIHPWVIPVASCDSAGRVTPESNLSPTIGARGLRAPGVNILTATPGGGYAPISGTSAAAAIVTGSMALLWSDSPATQALDLRASVLQSAGRERRSLVPPLLDVEAARRHRRSSVIAKENDMSDDTTAQAEISAAPGFVEPLAAIPKPALRGPSLSRNPTRARVVGQTAPCPTCATGELQSSGPPAYIFAIGQVRMRIPSPSIEKEFAQSIAADDTARLTDLQVQYNALKEYSHLANEVCWVFAVDSVETYVLVGRDQNVLDKLVEAVKPSDRGQDTDVVIGTRGPMAPPEMCNGLVAPIVLVDQIYSFDKPQLMNSLVAAAQKAAGPKAAAGTGGEDLRQSSNALFERIQQMADNVGAMDEHRAVNYLAVRYQQIYTHTADMYARDFSLTRVDVSPSRLAGTRKLVNVILTYTNRKTDVEEKYRARVDVTEKYPFLEKKLTPYFDVD